ncbi:hypothetical protein G0U57_021704, partial [Chelydra serpentina]
GKRRPISVPAACGPSARARPGEGGLRTQQPPAESLAPCALAGQEQGSCHGERPDDQTLHLPPLTRAASSPTCLQRHCLEPPEEAAWCRAPILAGSGSTNTKAAHLAALGNSYSGAKLGTARRGPPPCLPML